MEMWSSGRIIQILWGAAILVCIGAMPALAQENQQPASQQSSGTQKYSYWDCISPVCTWQPQSDKTKNAQPYGGGTPLDVILNTRFWTDVPEAKDFVKESRPPEATLHFQTTGGKDIARPKLRTSHELKAMEDELERAGAAADRAAGVKSNFHIEAKKKTKPLDSTQKPLDLSATAKTSQQ
jgi:hypothetical protein